MKHFTAILLLFCLLTVQAQPSEKKYKFRGERYIKWQGKIIYHSLHEWKLLNADFDTFRTLNSYDYNSFAFDKNGIYLAGKLIDTDTTGFKSFHSSSYWMNKNNMYCYDKILPGRDMETLEYIGNYYYKDQYKVYYETEVVEGADPSSFYLVNDKYAVDKNYVYYKGNVITFDSLPAQMISPSFFKTKKAVYDATKYLTYPGLDKQFPEVDATTLEPLIPPVLNQETERLIFSPYSIDKNSIYSHERKMADRPVNLDTVRVIRNSEDFYLQIGDSFYKGYFSKTHEQIGTDTIQDISSSLRILKKGIYWSGRRTILPFKYDFPIQREDICIPGNGTIIYKDQVYNFIIAKLVEVLSKEQVESIKRGENFNPITREFTTKLGHGYYKGKRHVNQYSNQYAPIERIDSKSFVPLARNYFKDKKGVYYRKSIYNKEKKTSEMKQWKIPKAHRKSFQPMENILYTFSAFAKDKKHVYSEDQIIPGVSPKGLELMAELLGDRPGYISQSGKGFEFYLFSNKDGYRLVSPVEYPDTPLSVEFLGKEFPKEILKVP